MSNMKCKYAFGKECQISECKYEPCDYPLVYQQGRADERKNVLQWVLNNFSDCEGICDIDICKKKYSNGECIDALLETYEEQLKEQNNENTRVSSKSNL